MWRGRGGGLGGRGVGRWLVEAGARGEPRARVGGVGRLVEAGAW